jgi:protein-S-isoprenylcysteine O-methyltransferase Ste14
MVLAGAAIILDSFLKIDALEFIGVKSFFGIEPKGGGLITKGAYGISRHPLYLGGMLILWSNPKMRFVDLILTFQFMLYFIVGGTLEERKLEKDFGHDYREYKKNVSMFFPFKWLKKVIFN